MPYSMVTKAFSFATKMHEGQFRRDGLEPYIFHPVRVASLVEGEAAKAVALLHDVVEDCYSNSPEGQAFGLKVLKGKGFTDEVVEAVAALTQRKYDGERSRTGEQYFDYIRRIKGNDLATQVKLADLTDNSRDLAPDDTLLTRYAKAKRILSGEED